MDDNNTLSAVWVDPAGKERAATAVAVSSQDRNAWVALALNDQAADRSSQLRGNSTEGPALVGEWQVDLRLNGRPLFTQSFTVRC